jgi:hypothetical protein
MLANPLNILPVGEGMAAVGLLERQKRPQWRLTDLFGRAVISARKLPGTIGKKQLWIRR